jgi:Hint domain-containing protein
VGDGTPHPVVNRAADTLSLATHGSKQHPGGEHGKGRHGEDKTPCFCRGTLILTAAGEIAVEALRVGDRVITISGTEKPITWIGRGTRSVTKAGSSARPVIVRRDALGDGVPSRDLRLTRGHSLYLDGMLVPVDYLANGRSILWDDEARSVEFYHFELPQHDVVYADGAPAESYREDGNRDWFDTAEPRPVGQPEPAWFAPVITGGPELNRLWHRLLARTGFTEPASTADPDLHLLLDGERVEAVAIDERRHGYQGRYRFRLEQRPEKVQIASRTVVPYLMGVNHDDRRLGVAVRSITLADSGCTLGLLYDAPQLKAGFHRPEPACRHRWTTGAAVLPDSLFAPFDGPFEMAIEIGCVAKFPLMPEGENTANGDDAPVQRLPPEDESRLIVAEAAE